MLQHMMSAWRSICCVKQALDMPPYERVHMQLHAIAFVIRLRSAGMLAANIDARIFARISILLQLKSISERTQRDFETVFAFSVAVFNVFFFDRDREVCY